MKPIIIYKSKSGFTKQYAEWIKEATKYDILAYKDISTELLSKYDTIIFGGRVHAGQIDGLKKIKTLISDKSIRLIVFATGATPIKAQDTINTVWKSNFTDAELEKIPHFYMQSGLSYERMGFGDRILMKALAKMLNSKKDKSSVEAGCEQAIESSYDISSKEYIKPLLECLQGYK